MDNLLQDVGPMPEWVLQRNALLFNYLHEGLEYPTPSPPTRDIELIRTSVNIPDPCYVCKRRFGTHPCAGCNAVKYCCEECQKYGSDWEGHKSQCNKIKKYRKETEDAIQKLAQDFGGIDALLESQLVKEGSFQNLHVAAGESLEDRVANNQQEEYILSRLRLTEAYANCGFVTLSCTAFRLAAENMLDIFCLERKNRNVENDKYMCCGWMVAAGMDQEALNFLCYFQHLLQSTISLPYLDMSKDEDIQGDSYLKLLKEPKAPLDWSTDRWFHDFMLIALIKYKRLQYLMVQKQKDTASFKMFLMGTHSRAGMESTIQKLRGNYLAIKKIQDYVMEEKIDFRIDQLNSQIEEILTAVNRKKPLIIPSIIDQDYSNNEISNDDLASDYINYGPTWNMSPSYPQVLQKFLDTGHVLSRDKLESNPVEGILQEAFDVDTTLWHGLWKSNPEHVLAVSVCLEWRRFLKTLDQIYLNVFNASAMKAAASMEKEYWPHNVERTTLGAEMPNPPEWCALGAESDTIPQERFTQREKQSTYSPERSNPHSSESHVSSPDLSPSPQ